MDLSKITALHIDSNSPFINASSSTSLTLEHSFENGIVVKPVVENGKVVRYIAHDKSGTERATFYATLSPNNRCLLCVEDEKRLQSYCIDIFCPQRP